LPAFFPFVGGRFFALWLKRKLEKSANFSLKMYAQEELPQFWNFLQKFREHKIEGKKKGRKKLHPSPVCVREGRRWNARLHATEPACRRGNRTPHVWGDSDT
jgi:hypothetical protein